MQRIVQAAALTLMVWLGMVAAVEAQQTDAETFVYQTRSRVNEGVVRIIAGEWGSTSLRIASDLAAVLDRRGDLRILPIVGKGSVQNITDLLYLKGIDLCIIQEDALDYVARNRIHTTTAQRIRYITKLHNEEFHLLVRDDIRLFQDLAGQPVNIGPEGSGSAVTATAAFESLGVTVQPLLLDHVVALNKLKAGEIAGLVYVTGKPAAFFRQIDDPGGLHLLSVPMAPELLSTYAPASFDHDDYPRLVDDQRAVETFAVGAVLAVYNWEPGSVRYRQAARFVDALFGGFGDLLTEARHPKWREINLAADVAGWTRFAAAQEWLDSQPTAAPQPGAPDATAGDTGVSLAPAARAGQ